MTLITQYDATSPAGIPLEPSAVDTPEKAKAANVAVAAYTDGDLPLDWRGCLAKYPELAKLGRVLSIASRFDTVATFMDYEPHNPCYGNPKGVAEWVLSMLDEHDVLMPGAYADRSDMPAIQAAFVDLKVPRDKTSLWLAAPGVNPQPFLSAGFDLVQDKFAGSFDVTVAKMSVYPSVDPPKPKPPEPVHKATVTFHGHHGGAHVAFKGGKWHVKPDHDGDWSVKKG